jgi:PHD/YefM family antitoxin component YafN of YafNO toxin-antitoxin module
VKARVSHTYSHVSVRADAARGRQGPFGIGRGPAAVEHRRVIITRHGHPAAVVMNVDDLESLEETLDIMDSATVLSDIRESLAELAATEPPVLTREDAI